MTKREIELIDNYKYERELRNKGIKLIAGVDEVGRGPLVGPVVAACCILPEKFQLDGLTAVNFEGFKLLNANTATYLQQHWTKEAPVSPTTTTDIDNMLITPSSATFYHQWSEYNTITKNGDEYEEVTDDVQGETFTTSALFCMENNTGAGTDGTGTNYLQGNTTGVLYKAHATVTGSDNYGGSGCFYGYNGEYFATLAAIQTKYSGVFNAATGTTPQEKLAAAQSELQACVAGTAGASVSDFRVKYSIRVYQNGVMYYTHYITDQNYVNEDDEHYHAIMRNTIYGLTVTSVKNIGDDVPGGWNPDVDPCPVLGKADQILKDQLVVCP